jgi:Uri superfamily endonuclease
MNLDPLNKKGIYILRVKGDLILEIGKLGKIRFEKGIYLYIGSAKAGFKRRIKRYFKKTGVKRWHIDYLLSEAELLGIILIPDDSLEEIDITERLAGIANPYAPGFGASDSKALTHLYKLSKYSMS